MVKRHTKRRSRLAKLTSSKTRMILSTVAVLILLLAVLELTDITHFFHGKTPASTKVIPSSTEPANSEQSAVQTKPTPTPNTTPSTPTKTTGSSSSSSPPSSSDGPVTPYGTFVSNHQPPQSGDYSEVSTCITTPGATCEMSFSNGSVTKVLTAQATDSSGTTIWHWNTQTAGLSVGHWTITVTATLNGKTATAHDTMDISQ